MFVFYLCVYKVLKHYLFCRIVLENDPGEVIVFWLGRISPQNLKIGLWPNTFIPRFLRV